MKKTNRRRAYRFALLVLIMALVPLSGHSGQTSLPTIQLPSLFIQVQQMAQARMRFAFPPPLSNQESTPKDDAALRTFALVQVLLLTLVATWWRLRLGHWGLR